MTFYIRLAFTSGLALRIKGAAYFTKSKLSETDNKIPLAAVYGVPAAALPMITVPPGDDAREPRLQIARAMEPCASE
jgi:hypothetical protein